MTTETPARSEAGTPRSEPRHGLRIALVWVVLAAICTPIVYFVWGPHMPPGHMSNAARGQQFDNQVLGTVATPVVLFIWVYFAYAIMFFRQRGDVLEDGVPLFATRKLATGWILVTSGIVLFAFIFGTYELISPNGAGGGEGPTAIWKPTGSSTLQVQVIAQQWRFTYRFPQFGGVETTNLELPVNRQIQFNVTSLDVIHSFWAIQLGVKADANPGINNVAYVKPDQTGPFTVRCVELCGIWHGAMYDYDSVVSANAFANWINNQQTAHAAVTKLLPPYALSYEPSKTGAGGDYYYNEPNTP